MNNMPENRRKKLKELLDNKEFVRVMEASNGLSGIIVENANYDGKKYNAIWISSFCDSALKGKPDNEVVDFTSRVQTINEIMEVTTRPIIFDGDTGGKIEHFVRNVQTLERLGVSAIIIEDKQSLKQNSLLGSNAEQILEEKEKFAYKIQCGKKALQTREFMIFARIESFIANKGLDDAMERAEAYIKAGADGIMIHSYKKDGKEIIEFLHHFRKNYFDVPVVLVPTTYHCFSEKELISYGANIVIYANHLLRSAYKAMKNTANMILKDESLMNVDEELCASMKEVLNLIGDSYD